MAGTTATMSEAMLLTAEVAKILGTTTAEVLRLVGADSLQVYNLNRGVSPRPLYRYRPEDVRAYQRQARHRRAR